MSEDFDTGAADTGVAEGMNTGGDDYAAIMQQLNESGFPGSDGTDTQAAEDASTDDGQQAETDEAEDEQPEEDAIKLKVNGKTISKSLNEVKALAQMQIAGEAKLEQAKKEIEEARTAKQRADGLVENVRQMLSVLQKGDFDTIADLAEKMNASEAFNQGLIQYALKLYEMAQMTPEQREAHENKKLVARLRQEAEERQRIDQQRAMEYQINQAQQHIAVEVPKALKEVGLPDTEFVREHVINTWRTALENGQNPTPLAVAAFVKKRLEESKMLGSQKAAPARPKATKDSIKRKTGQEPQSQYISMTEWQNARKGH